MISWFWTDNEDEHYKHAVVFVVQPLEQWRVYAPTTAPYTIRRQPQ